MPSVVKQSLRPKKAGSKIQSAWDLPLGIRMLLYGRSGTGKTTLWSSFPGPILAIICSGGNKPGELRSINTPAMRKKVDARIVQSIDQVKELISDADQFQTIVLDHASGLQDLTLKEILGLEELPAQKSWGMASQQQYGQSSLMCKEILRSLLSLDGNVVIIAQEREFEASEGSEIAVPYVGAAMTPSVVGWLNPACDYVVQTFIRPKMDILKTKVNDKVVETKKRGKGVQYCLRTGPHDVFTTKFRVPKGTELPEIIVDPSYEKILELIDGN